MEAIELEEIKTTEEIEIEVEEIDEQVNNKQSAREEELQRIEKQSVDEERIIQILKTKPEASHPWPFTKCLPTFTPNEKFLKICKRSVYQFVVIKPLTAFIAIFLQYKGWYDDGNLSPNSSYLYLIIVDNISVTLAMYALVLFYTVTQEELQPFKPVPKFLCIKSVILFAFWQGIIIAILVWFGIIHGDDNFNWTDREISVGLQDFLICIEMFFISIAHTVTFGHKPYRSGEASCEDIPCYSFICCCCCCVKVTKNLSHVVSQRDVLQDGVEIFSIDKVPHKISAARKKATGKIGHAVGSLWENKTGEEISQTDGDAGLSMEENEIVMENNNSVSTLSFDLSESDEEIEIV